jgi:cell division transport system ATP-binding protein
MIQMFHVSKEFPGGVAALNDISLEVGRGEFYFVTGPSGAGKSTLLRLIMGMESLTGGQLLVNGRNLTRIPSAELTRLRRSTGFVFQDFKLLNNRTAMENVALALQIHGLHPKTIRQKAYQTLRAVGLAEKRDQKTKQLSGGEQQRVAIARALVNHPDILLADEPTGNLDPAISREIMDQFLSIHRQGTTVLVATHSEEMVKYCGQKRILLERGRFVGIRE